MTFDPSMYGLSTDPAASGFGGYYDVNGTRYYFEGQQQVPGGAGMTPAQQAALATISDPYANDASKQAAAATYQQALLSPSGGGLTAPLPGIGLPGPGGTGGTGALPGGGGGGGAGGGGTAQQRDAYSLIKSELSNYGLTSPGLADWVWQEIVDGKSSNEVLLDLRQRPEFKAAFPEIDGRQKAGLAPLSPGDIVSYRNEARQLYRAAGLPPGFFDSNASLTDLMVKNVSLSELSQRITDAAQEANNAPPEDRAQFQALFGHGGLTAMFFDPDIAEPLLRKQLAAAQLSGSGVRSGFGALTAHEALNLTDLGVTQGQADQGFGLLQHEQQLFNPLDAGETAISRQDQIAAGLGGNAMAQQRIQDRARRRVAAFSGGGNFSGSSSGLSGFGSSGG